MEARFLEMLLAGASREELDAVVAGSDDPRRRGPARSSTRRRCGSTSRWRGCAAARPSSARSTRPRRDLSAIRDLDEILTAIVRRARHLLHADMTYLSLNDEGEGASYMKVTDGALTPEFRTLRLPLGTGLLGLVAQSGEPYFTADYRADQRFVHRDFIDDAVAGEHIRAILGVPLTRGGHGHRRPAGRAPHGPAVPAGRGRAADQLRRARRGRARERPAVRAERRRRPTDESCGSAREATERAAGAHDALTDVLLHGGDVGGGGRRAGRGARRPAVGPRRRRASCSPATDAPVEDATWCGRRAPPGGRVRTDDGAWVAVAAAGDRAPRARSCCAPTADRTCPSGARWSGGPGDGAGAAVRPHRRGDRGAGCAGELLADLLDGRDLDRGLRERARRQRAAGSTPAAGVAVVERRRRWTGTRAGRAVAGRLAGRAAGLVGEHGRRRGARRPGRRPAGRRTRMQDRARAGGATATVGVAGGDRRASRAAWHEAAPLPRRPARLGRRGEVSDPAGLGLARLLLGENGPERARRLRRRDAGAGARLRRRARHPAGRDPRGVVRRRRRGCATTAARAARPPEHGDPAAGPGRPSCSEPDWREPHAPARRAAGAAGAPAPRRHGR